MIRTAATALITFSLCVLPACAQEHQHAAPEKLGKVSFSTTCDARVQASFNRAVALLHSFTYAPAAEAFQKVADEDPGCAMAHWGAAMSYYHQLWEPALPGDAVQRGKAELDLSLIHI